MWKPLKGKVFPKVNLKSLQNFPLPKITLNEQKPFIENGKTILDLNEKLKNEIYSFHKYLKRDFNIIKVNKKLTEYYNLSYDEFYKEVKKQYNEITRKESDKLEKEFKVSLDSINPLKKEISTIDKEIDQLVYELYDLTEEEIAIIEKEGDGENDKI